MRGFIIYPTYEVRGGGVVVQLYGRLENGETFLAEMPYVPYFFIRKKDLKEAQKLVTIEPEDSELKSMDGEPVVRVNVKIPKDVPPLRKELEDAGIPCYEADIRFAYRFLIDQGITGDLELDGRYVKGKYVGRVYDNPKINSAEWNGELNVLSLDIETDKKATQLYSISLVTKKRSETLIVGKKVSNATYCEDEKELLDKLNQLIMEIDPDVITGWNVIDFDLKFLANKYDEHKIKWAWARADRDSKLRIMSDFWRESTADITGRMVLDGLALLRASYVKLDDYKLETAAKTLLGEGKIFSGEGRYDQIEEAYQKDPHKLVEYNKKDAKLVLDIFDKTNTMELAITKSKLTGMALDRTRASIASLDMVYLPKLRERGFVAPCSGHTAKEEPITGGFVMSSVPGIYDYVIVCDFKSLYPSIMRTINIDPLAYDPKGKAKKSDKQYYVAENGANFRRELGILPGIIQYIWAERDKLRKKGDEIGRYALKVLMNSFFGVLASPNCRFFSMEVANAITHTAQYMIKTTIKEVERQGYKVIYADTDSCFIDLHVDSEAEAEKTGKEIEQSINKFMEAHIKDRYQTRSYLELEFEKTFIRFFMPKTRSGEGSKKRYAGLVKKKGKQDIDFTGLEFVRRDWTEVSKHFQLGVLDLVFHKKDPQYFIKKFVDELKNGKYDEFLVYRKALRKRAEEYTKTTPPHVKAARLLPKITSNIIAYVMTTAGPEPLGYEKHKIDYDHYIEKQLKPIADSILAFYGTKFDDVMKGSSQKGLFEF